ncbi:uncharacterized protein LOC131927100 [Physella acuta]|uniref:uncharacterized protein LOC131927100 n=1 Tax=Physella acuta TaxID=109671 RepID=UPI0027DABC12|nr:uncharacterized protein LOC131927100 [Physella acuta]
MRSTVPVKEQTMICLIVMICLINLADSLLCYQCVATAPNMPCVNDYQGMVNTSLGIGKAYFKNCTAANITWDRCVIVYVEQYGSVQFFNRECHDGKTFQSKIDLPEFHNLPANNETTCGRNYDGQAICFRFCQTDFCNGPQKPPEVEKKSPCNESTMLDYFDDCSAASLLGPGFLMLQLAALVLVLILVF